MKKFLHMLSFIALLFVIPVAYAIPDAGIVAAGMANTTETYHRDKVTDNVIGAGSGGVVTLTQSVQFDPGRGTFNVVTPRTYSRTVIEPGSLMAIAESGTPILLGVTTG